MTSSKLKFRAHTDNTKDGALYFQIIHNRTVKQVKTYYHIYEYEWDKQRCDIVKDFSAIGNTERGTEDYPR